MFSWCGPVDISATLLYFMMLPCSRFFLFRRPSYISAATLDLFKLSTVIWDFAYCNSKIATHGLPIVSFLWHIYVAFVALQNTHTCILVENNDKPCAAELCFHSLEAGIANTISSYLRKIEISKNVWFDFLIFNHFLANDDVLNPFYLPIKSLLLCLGYAEIYWVCFGSLSFLFVYVRLLSLPGCSYNQLAVLRQCFSDNRAVYYIFF